MRLSRHPEAIKYKRRFWRLLFLHLPHHSLLVLGTRVNARWLVNSLSSHHDKTLNRLTIKRYSVKDVNAYKVATQHTKLWHGTGRLQYTDEQKTRDIFAAIVKNNALTPSRDVYALLIGGQEMTSLSTTPLRILARSYADTHGKGEKEANRYGSSLWWVAYYYSLFYGLVFTKYSPLVLRNLPKWNKASKDARGERAWGKKVHTKAYSVWEVFGVGSDIAGNYPIVFGVKRFGRVAKLPKNIREVEVRLTDPISFSDLSHIEVPEDKIEEVKEMLAQHNYTTPVFPIELGEYITSQESFMTIIGVK